MIKCIELNKEFATQKELFEALKANKSLLIANKKAEVKTKGNLGFLGFMDIRTNAVKGIPDMKEDYIYPVISNTNYVDNHKDVHLDGSMSRTAKNQNRKVFYLADHKLEHDSVIATPKNVEVMLVKLKWKDLGKDYEGETEALVFKIAKDKIIHDKFLKMIEDGVELQNSIRMLYVELDMAINSEDEGYEDAYKLWTSIYPKIANKEVADESGYFWAVKELKLHLEGSSVLFGSNDATPTKNIAGPSEDTRQKTAEELAQALQESQKSFYQSILKS